MFNVLPDNIKEFIRNEYETRRWLVIFGSILFIQISFLIFLLPSWTLSKYLENIAINKANSQNVLTPSKNTGGAIQSINSTNQTLNIINSTFMYSQVFPFLNTVISYKTSDITINEFTYANVGTSTISLTVTGLSNTRESLIMFVKNLQKSSLFQEVNSPVSNLVKDKKY